MSISLKSQVKEQEKDIGRLKYPDITRSLKSLCDARAIIRAGSNMLIFKRMLVKKIHLFGKEYSTKLDIEDEKQQMILDTWIEEILKFLVLKSIMNDIYEPFQLLPGYIIGEGWRCLMLCASVYSKICISIGTRTVFDHNPEDTCDNRLEDQHNIKRHNFTIRSYSKYFDQQPPSLYWSFHKRKEFDPEDNIISSFGKMCGLDTSSMSSPFQGEEETGIVVSTKK